MKDKKVVKLRKNNFFKNSVYIPFIILITGLLILAFSPIFDITDIQIEGNLKLTENSIKNASNIKIGQNILRINKNFIYDNIKQLPYIKDVSIKRKWPNCIIISVIERTEIAKLQALGSILTIDSNGQVLESYSDDSVIDLPLIENIEILSYGINKEIDSPDINKLNNILQVLKIFKKNGIVNKVEKIFEENDIIAHTKEGHIVVLGDLSDLDYKVKRIKASIEKEQDEKYYFNVSNINISTISKPLWTLMKEKQYSEVVE